MDGNRCHHPIRSFHRVMRVTATVAVALGSVLSGLIGPAGVATADTAFPPSEKIFPATTRGWVSISHGPEFRQRFNRTQYGLLLKDPSMKPFIESVRKELEGSNSGRLGRLGLTLDDLLEVAGGEYALGAVESPAGKLATVVLVDVTGHDAEARGLVDKMNTRMVEQKGTKVAANGGGPLTVYQFNASENSSRPGEQRIAFALAGSTLLVGDDPALVTQVMGTLGQGRGDCVGSLPAFGAVMGRCQSQVPATAAAVRW